VNSAPSESVPERSLDIVILGLAVTSSWGNGHATTYRALIRGLTQRGHRVLFLERDVPWYATRRDQWQCSGCTIELYNGIEDLHRYANITRTADVAILGSFVPEGVAVGNWLLETASGVTAFYDIDTPVTLAKLARQDYEYLSPDLIAGFDLYLSFTGGPTLERLEQEYKSRCARALYCAVDPELYFPESLEPRYDLGYMGTYSIDRQPVLERLLIEPARQWPGGRFVVAGPQYPANIDWPANVGRLEHVAPQEHRRFYNSQRYTLNVTREDMVRAGYAPSVRLFEAAACGVLVISDWWQGLDEFFIPGEEILVSKGPEETLKHMRYLDEHTRAEIAAAARRKVLAHHTCQHRAAELEQFLADAGGCKQTMSESVSR
jgi:spore maturation protein CgeB